MRIDPAYRDEHIDTDALEARIRAAIRSWDDDFSEALGSDVGEEEAARIAPLYGPGLPDAYREAYSARAAVADIRTWESLSDGQIAVSLYEPLDAPSPSADSRSSGSGGP